MSDPTPSSNTSTQTSTWSWTSLFKGVSNQAQQTPGPTQEEHEVKVKQLDFRRDRAERNLNNLKTEAQLFGYGDDHWAEAQKAYDAAHKAFTQAVDKGYQVGKETVKTAVTDLQTGVSEVKREAEKTAQQVQQGAQVVRNDVTADIEAAKRGAVVVKNDSVADIEAAKRGAVVVKNDVVADIEAAKRGAVVVKNDAVADIEAAKRDVVAVKDAVNDNLHQEQLAAQFEVKVIAAHPLETAAVSAIPLPLIASAPVLGGTGLQMINATVNSETQASPEDKLSWLKTTPDPKDREYQRGLLKLSEGSYENDGGVAKNLIPRDAQGQPKFHAVTDDELQKMGFKAGDFKDPKTGFFAQLYQDNETKKYVVSFRGTDPGHGPVQQNNDIKADIEQYAGLESRQYDETQDLAKSVVRKLHAENVTFVGHSKGGGQASVAGLLTHTQAVVFNPAWVSQANLEKLNIHPGEAEKYVTAFHLTTDPLNAGQKILNGDLGHKILEDLKKNPDHHDKVVELLVQYGHLDPKEAKEVVDRAVDGKETAVAPLGKIVTVQSQTPFSVAENVADLHGLDELDKGLVAYNDDYKKLSPSEIQSITPSQKLSESQEKTPTPKPKSQGNDLSL